MRPIMTSLLAVATVALLTSCSVSKRSDVCTADNDGKETTVTGYVSFGGFSMISGNEFPLRLVESMSAEDYIIAYVPMGEGENTLKKLPDSFTQDDIELRLDDGGTKGYGSRVAVTGTLSVSDDYCALRKVTKVASP